MASVMSVYDPYPSGISNLLQRGHNRQQFSKHAHIPLLRIYTHMYSQFLSWKNVSSKKTQDYTYDQLMFNECVNIIQWENDSFFNDGAGEIEYPQNSYLYHTQKWTQMNQIPNCGTKTTILLEENIG